MIRGDAACPFQYVAASLAACKDAQISDLGITVAVAEGAATRSTLATISMRPQLHDHRSLYWGLTTTTWLVLWSILATLTVLLVVLLRTRWSQARPWRKCAILSLWVHVLLAVWRRQCGSVTGAPSWETTNRFVSRCCPSVETSSAARRGDYPDWEQPNESPTDRRRLSPLSHCSRPDRAGRELEPLPAPEPLPPAPPLEAPALLAAPEPAQTLSATLKQPSRTGEPASTPSSSRNNHANPKIPHRHRKHHRPTQPDLPDTYSDRFAKDREALVEQRGGSAQTERAVRAALGWLATAQSENGGWDASRFGAGDARVVLSQDRRGAGAEADMGVTGLALLAFLGAGHTHSGGDYTHEVASGLEYLRQRQRADGSLYGDAHFFARMYSHSMATFAVCEASGSHQGPAPRTDGPRRGALHAVDAAPDRRRLALPTRRHGRHQPTRLAS